MCSEDPSSEALFLIEHTMHCIAIYLLGCASPEIQISEGALRARRARRDLRVNRVNIVNIVNLVIGENKVN